MKKTVLSVTKYTMLAVAVGVASGCANQEVTKMIEDNQKAAANALDLARSAQSAANDANRKADAALREAQDAKRCCNDDSERNRRFEKKMYK